MFIIANGFKQDQEVDVDKHEEELDLLEKIKKDVHDRFAGFEK